MALRQGTRASLAELTLALGSAPHISQASARVWTLTQVGVATKALGQRTARIVTAARKDARQTALERLTVESGATAAPSDGAEDAGLGEVAGSSYAAAWGAALMREVLAWADDPRGLPRLKAASDSQDYRLGRIAATEVSRAYNDEHAEAARDLKGLTKTWCALLDRGICKACRALDEQTIPVAGKFAKGLEPGEVHPMCRCIEVVVGPTIKPQLDTPRSATAGVFAGVP